MPTGRVWHMPESVMRTKTFRPYDQDTLLLMPPSVRDWVDPDGLPAFVDALVEELDLAPFLAAHEEPRGMPPYHPAMMLKILLYGYAIGVRSSRKLEERLGSDVAFMFLAGQARPDHKTISEFRRRHLSALEALFTESLRLCREAGMVRLGRVALDGTKVKANASKHKAMSYGRMAEREAALEAEVARILEEAEAIDAAEDERHGEARGDELPPVLRTREGRLRKLREAKAALEAEARERSGDPAAVPDPKAQRSFTDPDSRIMHSKPDGFIYGYNAQLVVDADHQVIVATDLDAATTDVAHLPAMVDRVEASAGRRPKRLLADAGYASDENLAHLEARGIDAYVATPARPPQRTATSDPAGSHPQGRHSPRADGPQAAHEAGPRRVRPSQGHRRARLRPAQGGPGLPPLQPPGQDQGDRRMAPRLRGPQPREALPQRPGRSGHPWLDGPHRAWGQPRSPRMGLKRTTRPAARAQGRCIATRSRLPASSDPRRSAITDAGS